jgi:hypothetical protein
MAMELPAEIISAPVKEFSRISGLGESTIWAMIHDGRLESIAIGRRRLVLIESYRRLIEQQRAAPPRDARRNSAVPPLGSNRRGAVPSSVTNAGAKTKRRGRSGPETAAVPPNVLESQDDPEPVDSRRLRSCASEQSASSLQAKARPPPRSLDRCLTQQDREQ